MNLSISRFSLFCSCDRDSVSIAFHYSSRLCVSSEIRFRLVFDLISIWFILCLFVFLSDCFPSLLFVDFFSPKILGFHCSRFTAIDNLGLILLIRIPHLLLRSITLIFSWIFIFLMSLSFDSASKQSGSNISFHTCFFWGLHVEYAVKIYIGVRSCGYGIGCD